MTVEIVDHSFKKRSDFMIEDVRLQDALEVRLVNRIVPEIERAFQYQVARIERWLVACYDATTAVDFQRLT